MHYRGRHGCRLTAIALEAAPQDPLEGAVAPDAQSTGLEARWTVGGIHFYLLANGMDRGRFNAIASYAMAESRRLNGQDDLRVAMQTATDHAQPCA